MKKYFSLMNRHSTSHKRTKPSSTDNKADTIEILTKYYEQKINSLQHQIDILRNEFKQDINNLRQNQNYNNNNGNSGNNNTNINNTNATTNTFANPIIKTKSKRNEHNSNTVSSFFHIKDEDKKIMLKTHHQIHKVHTNTIIKHNNNKFTNNNNTGVVDFYNKKHNVEDSFKGKKQRHTKSSSFDNNNNSRNNKRINVNRNNTYNKNNINKIQALIVLINSSVSDYELKCKIVFLCKQTKQYIHSKQHLINIAKDNIRINKDIVINKVNEIINVFPSKTAVFDVNFCSKDNESCIYSLIDSDEVYSQFYDIVKKICNVNQNEQKQSISKLIYTYIIVYRTIVFTIYHTQFISI